MLKDYEVGTAIAAELVLSAASMRKTKTNKDFLTLTFTDGLDNISGNIWDYDVSKSLPEVNKIYAVKGVMGEYAGFKQLNIKDYWLAPDQDMTRFSRQYVCPFTLEELWTKLIGCIEYIENPALRYLVGNIYTQNKLEIMAATAATTVHHVGMGGVMFHTYDTCNIALTLVPSIKSAYPDMPLSVDVVLAGTLLHDIGKARTQQVNGAVIDYTLEGHLYEHIHMGAEMVLESYYNLIHSGNNVVTSELYDTVQLVIHCILSHHERLEYGSPVTPKCLEAFIVSLADKMSATADIYYQANLRTTVNAVTQDTGTADIVTDRIYALGNNPVVTQHYISEVSRRV